MKSSCVGREHGRIVRWRRDDTETDEFRTAHDMTDAAEDAGDGRWHAGGHIDIAFKVRVENRHERGADVHDAGIVAHLRPRRCWEGFATQQGVDRGRHEAGQSLVRAEEMEDAAPRGVEAAALSGLMAAIALEPGLVSVLAKG